MPVRAIISIQLGLDGTKEGELAIRVPKSIVNGFRLMEDDIFVCEFKKLFNSEKKPIREINEIVEVHCEHFFFGDEYYEEQYLAFPHIIILTDLDLTKKYGFLVYEYLEIIFKEIKRGKESIPIFPERMIEESQT